ncbi:MAG: hypothetical protein K1X29_10010 [Bdellovibrionales bacterium]|nr:hypothetical protein [Bdellovibrionales bacterium]
MICLTLLTLACDKGGGGGSSSSSDATCGTTNSRFTDFYYQGGSCYNGNTGLQVALSCCQNYNNNNGGGYYGYPGGSYSGGYSAGYYSGGYYLAPIPENPMAYWDELRRRGDSRPWNAVRSNQWCYRQGYYTCRY